MKKKQTNKIDLQYFLRYRQKPTMSGFELLGLVFGLTSPLEQAIKSSISLHNHIQSYRKNIDIVATLLKSLQSRKSELQKLHNLLSQHRFSLEEINFQIYSDRLNEITKIFDNVQETLSGMEQSANRNLIHFLKATSWAEECRIMQQRIEETGNRLLQISGFLTHSIDMTSFDQRTASIGLSKPTR